MLNFFNRQPNVESDEFNGLFSALMQEEDDVPTASPLVTVVQTTTTKVSIRTADVTIEAEQTDTTVTTAPVEAFLECEELDEVEELEGVYFVDVDLVDTYSTRSLMTAAIAEFCANNYAKAEVVNRDGSIVTVRFTSPLRSSIEQMALVAGADEDAITWMAL